MVVKSTSLASPDFDLSGEEGDVLCRYFNDVFLQIFSVFPPKQLEFDMIFQKGLEK